MYQQTNDPKNSYKNVGHLEPIPSIIELKQQQKSNKQIEIQENLVDNVKLQ
jgi:hypothetical protein